MLLRPAALLVLVAVSAPALAQPADPGGLRPFASDAELEAFVRDLAERRPAPPPPVTAPCAGPADPTAVLAGRVVDGETGDALPGATVLLLGVEACGAAADADGRFRFALDAAAVAGGEVAVQAALVGYHRAEVSAAVAPGDSVAVEVALDVDDGAYDEVVVTALGVAAAESVTNVQTAGVDEGGIVKLHRDHLVVLRRGRLFTVAVGDGALRPADAVDAWGPGLDPSGTWYDELLVVGETAVVVGYSYARGGTEVGLFDIGPEGELTYQATYHLRSNDYYSAENYASRVVDGRLVFYAPLALRGRGGDAADWLPALRRWDGDADGRFEPIASATRVYRPARDLDGWNAALHTVTTCAVEDGALDCDATAVFGPFGHTVYVSGSAAYAWLSGWRRTAGGAAPAVLYRLPLDGGRPGALGVAGGPIDQFSFLEAGDTLNVVVSEWGGGQWMWRSERSRHGLALARIPLDALGDGADDAPPAWYRRLPVPAGGVDVNRFVGGHLLYGSSYADGGEGRVQIVAWGGPETVHTLRTGHAAERVEVLGEHAVVVGADRGDLRFTAVRLGERPRRAGRFRLPGAAQGETRSHGFFYRPSGDEHGTLGLPVRRRGGRYASLHEGSASVVYLRNRDLDLRLVGALDASPETPDDGCRASCVDWYGNARPLFVGSRVFALLGYEVVEGQERAGRMEEVARVSFAPAPPLSAR